MISNSERTSRLARDVVERLRARSSRGVRFSLPIPPPLAGVIDRAVGKAEQSLWHVRITELQCTRQCEDLRVNRSVQARLLRWKVCTIRCVSSGINYRLKRS